MIFKKIGVWLFPIIVFLVTFLLLFGHGISEERHFPAPGWSRTIEFPVATGDITPYAYADKDGLHVYTSKGGSITVINFTKALTIKKKRTINTSGEVQRLIWGHSEKILYKQDGNLFIYHDGKHESLAKSVGDAAYQDNNVFYAKDKKLMKLNLQTGQTEETAFSEPIVTLTVADNGDIVVVTNDDAQQFRFYYLKASEAFKGHHHPFTQHLAPSHAYVSNLQILWENDQLGIFFTQRTIQKGNHDFNYFLQMPKAKLEVKKPAEWDHGRVVIHFPNGRSASEDMMDFRLAKGPTLVFNASGYRTHRDTAVNIYEAKLNSKGEWIAERRSTSAVTSQKPVWAGDETLFWLDGVSYQKFQLAGASKNHQAIDKSSAITREDVIQALSFAALSLGRGLLFLLIAILCTVPAILVYGIISFTKVEWIERESPIVKYVCAAAFLVGQWVLILYFASGDFTYYAPGYLTFPLANYLLPLAIAVLTWLMTMWVKNKEWGMAKELLYFFMLFMIAEFFLYGPYFF
ncbi:hypothetical protein ACFO4N_15520 [Camelliibacillus cellulosilyticus]|uniref:Uncharacterized protein n=1 Tax=Camelliibacillus cellulosilyticus TaxID=2174486 RepID=A0ABV9GQ46_9BACL